MRSFLTRCSAVFWRRVKLFAVLNMLFFLSFLVVILATSFLTTPPLSDMTSDGIAPTLFGDTWSLMIFNIFIFNIVMSAFIMITLPGFALFPLSGCLLLFRAALWGELLAFASATRFVLALPTLILEAEAYVLAAVGGTVLGLSWLKPLWVFRGESVSRVEALKKAVKEAAYLYFFVTLILAVAAVVERVTLTYLGSA